MLSCVLGLIVSTASRSVSHQILIYTRKSVSEGCDRMSMCCCITILPASIHIWSCGPRDTGIVCSPLIWSCVRRPFLNHSTQKKRFPLQDAMCRTSPKKNVSRFAPFTVYRPHTTESLVFFFSSIITVRISTPFNRHRL